MRRFRQITELSQEQVGAKIHVTGSAIGKIERGEVRCEPKTAELLDQVLDAKGTIQSLWEKLVLNAAFPVWFDWPTVEAEAIELQTYQCLVVYGLLQTEDYARALLGGREEAVKARMGRQQILTRTDPAPPRLTVIMAEAVLYNQVGDREIMRDQLEHLATISSDLITIQVVPAPLHPAGTDGAFVIATLGDLNELVHVSMATRGLTLNEPEDIKAARSNLADIRARALPVDMSLDVIRKVMEERWT